MGKTDRIIIGFVFGIPMMVFFIVVIYNVFSSSATSGREYYLQNKREISINGIVDSIYREEFNHNILVLRISKKKIFSLPPEWENKFEVGDSVVKEYGVLTVRHYRDGKLMENLNYSDVIMK